MKINCPRCAKVQEIMPDDLIGRYMICKKCHNIFLWKNYVTPQEPHETHKKNPNSDKPDPFNK